RPSSRVSERESAATTSEISSGRALTMASTRTPPHFRPGPRCYTRIMKKLLGFIVLLLIAAGLSWYGAGREAGPRIAIVAPQSAIGRAGSLTLDIDSPGGRLKSLDVALEQGKARASIFHLDASDASALVHDGANRVRLTRP